jgi:hypothetical protein
VSERDVLIILYLNTIIKYGNLATLECNYYSNKNVFSKKYLKKIEKKFLKKKNLFEKKSFEKKNLLKKHFFSNFFVIQS